MDSARALIARGWGVSLVSRCLRVSRAQLHVILRRTDDWKDGRRSRHSDDTDVLLRIHHVIGELPTYGYRRVRAYWLDLNYGEKKKVSVKRRKPPKPQKEKSSSREGDYMEGAEGNVFVLRKTYQNEQAARRAAAAKWQQLQRGAASFSITLARGRAELYPEMHGTVTGFKSEIDNQDWIIAKAEHTIDNSGFTTQLELEAKIPEWIAETE